MQPISSAGTNIELEYIRSFIPFCLVGLDCISIYILYVEKESLFDLKKRVCSTVAFVTSACMTMVAHGPRARIVPQFSLYRARNARESYN